MGENTCDKTELPLWRVENMIIFPTCKELVELRNYGELEIISEAQKTGGRIFVAKCPCAEPSGIPHGAGGAGQTEDVLASAAEGHMLGTVCEIKDVIRNDDDTYDVLICGEERAICRDIRNYGGKSYADFAVLSDIQPKTAMEIDCCKVYKRRIKQLLRQYTKAFFRAMGRAKDVSVLDNIGDFSTFGFRAARFAELEPNCNTELLLCDSVMLRLEKLLRFLNDELQFLNLSDKILTTVQQALSKQQKDMFLREQIRAIQHELGEDELSEADELEERIYDLERYIPSETSSIMLKSLSRLKRMSVMSPEYQVMKSHIEFLIDLPWAAPRKQTINPDKVRSVLDRDHFGMEKVKERIVEYMAVKSLEKSTVNTVICLYGPPGTGKTSIAKSIAEALNRKYIRVSLGGVHDEAEIRGHRKTYVGAMPGRILNSIKNCGSKNPVMLLDEIDKMCGDFKGDPSSALLEVLDREQNKMFRDNYAEIPFDLSDVIFITTANSLEPIPAPLRDRLEIIELSSYTEDEKLEIARNHLLPRQIKEHGLRKNAVTINNDAILMLIREYTHEAGVRELERKIAALLRKSICIMQRNGKKTYSINAERVHEMLGAGNVVHRFETGADVTEVGTANGMAWTSVGGVLLSVEVNVLDGNGKLEVTGLIGDVMRESAQAALSYIRSRADEFGLPADFYRTKDIHIHVPEGATPKDGPSAGVTITTAILSALTGIPVKQCVAMTGEITLRGEVLAIGGLKEKSLAALKEGISTIVVPSENSAEVSELPDTVKRGLKIVKAVTIDDVLKTALADGYVKPADGARCSQ